MAQRRSPARSGNGRDHYFALVRRLPLRPIRSESELDAAIAMIDALTDRDNLNAGEADYLDVLSDLVERYEEEAHPIGNVSNSQMLAFLIDQKGVQRAEVARSTGIAESTLSEVLRGKRELTQNQIAKVAAYFRVGVRAFMPNPKASRRTGKARESVSG